MNIKKSQITVSGITVDVLRKDIKNIHLSVHPPTGRVRVSSPRRVDTESLRLFIVSKLGWIKKHMHNIQSQNRQPPREFIQGESHYFQGQRYLMNIIEHNHPPKVVIRNKKYLDLYVRPGSSSEKRKQVVKEWYRSELKQQIPPLIEKWEQKTGIKVHDWGVRQMKTRWGSANTQAKRIWLNLELAKKSPECLEYVVVHEMMHMKERLHNGHFKALMDQYLPKWREIKEELNQRIF